MTTTQTSAPYGRRAALQSIVSIVTGCVVILLMIVTGSVTAERDLLIFVGFDPDRAVLLTALTVGGAAAFAAALLTGQRRIPALLGPLAVAVVFGSTFIDETRVAVHAHGTAGSFDPQGWILTVLTLTVASLVVGWAMATIGAAVRSSLQLTWQRTRALVRRRGVVGVANVRVASTIAVATLLVVTTASLAALINYSPDALFHLGSGNFGLFTSDGGANGTPRPGQSHSPGGPQPTPFRSLVPGPSTPGRMVETQLPAPWTGGTTDTISVSVYLPGDYDTSLESYPVMYFVPWTFKMWDDGAGIQRILDGLISSGQIPPTIAVFASTDGGPFVDSECVDSFDGAELMETYLSDTLPAWVDGNYRTLRDPAHRALLGLSQGGFCATMLLLRHPDVFRQAASFGGYYTAGIKSGQTNNAWRPFGPASGAQNRIADHSPILLARLVPPEQRSDLFMYITGSPDQPFYGDQYTAFKTELAGDGIPSQTIDTPVAHSWTAVKVSLPDALSAIAAAQAAVSPPVSSPSPAPLGSAVPTPTPSEAPPTLVSPTPTVASTPGLTASPRTPFASIAPSRTQ